MSNVLPAAQLSWLYYSIELGTLIHPHIWGRRSCHLFFGQHKVTQKYAWAGKHAWQALLVLHYNCYGEKVFSAKDAIFSQSSFSKGAGTNGWNASTMHILCIRSGNIMVMTMNEQQWCSCPRKRGEFRMICLNLISKCAFWYSDRLHPYFFSLLSLGLFQALEFFDCVI